MIFLLTLAIHSFAALNFLDEYSVPKNRLQIKYNQYLEYGSDQKLFAE